MTDKKTKTKAEMLRELESIKGLLHEEDDIPILQETILHTAISQETIAGEKMIQKNTVNDLQKPKSHIANGNSQHFIGTQTSDMNGKKSIEQQDFFSTPTNADSATQLLNTLNDLAAIAETVTSHKTASGYNANEKNKLISSRADSVKAVGENPFLPEHIRTRLHGNNPPPFFEIATAKKIANSSRPTTQLGNTQPGNAQNTFTATKPVSHQQELIEDIVEAMLPEIEQALRERLSTMSKEMLEILIAESKQY